jgi:hypothetical protein
MKLRRLFKLPGYINLYHLFMFWSGRGTRSIMAAHYRMTIFKDNLALLRLRAEWIPPDYQEI